MLSRFSRQRLSAIARAPFSPMLLFPEWLRCCTYPERGQLLEVPCHVFCSSCPHILVPCIVSYLPISSTLTFGRSMSSTVSCLRLRSTSVNTSREIPSLLPTKLDAKLPIRSSTSSFSWISYLAPLSVTWQFAELPMMYR